MIADFEAENQVWTPPPQIRNRGVNHKIYNIVQFMAGGLILNGTQTEELVSILNFTEKSSSSIRLFQCI
jgi:hypothetical protein